MILVRRLVHPLAIYALRRLLHATLQGIFLVCTMRVCVLGRSQLLLGQDVQIFRQVLPADVGPNDADGMLIGCIGGASCAIYSSVLRSLGTVTGHHVWVQRLACFFRYFERAVDLGRAARGAFFGRHSLRNRHLLHFVSDPLVIPQLILPTLLLFKISLPLLLFNLLLQCLSHRDLLLLSFGDENGLFIAAL